MAENRIGTLYGNHLYSDNPGGIAEARDIAYETSVNNDGISQSIVMTKSVATKLEEIDTALLNIDNTEVIELKVLAAVDVVAQNVPSTASIEAAVTAAETAQGNAETAATTATNKATEAEQTFYKLHYGYYVDSNNNIVAVPRVDGTFLGIGVYNGQTPLETSPSSGEWRIKQANSDQYVPCFFVKSMNTYTDEFNHILEVSDAFATAFDVDALFAIISEDSYALLQNKQDNTIYFIY